MNRNLILWLVAFVVTVAVAYVQRVTGPTYALSGRTQLGGKAIEYKLPRSHGGESNAPIVIQCSDSSVEGFVEWKRLNADDRWTKVEMKHRNGAIATDLPHQPPAGKLLYRITLTLGNEAAIVPAGDPVVIRFKGDVPSAILIAHVLAMFGSMLFAARAGLEYFNTGSSLKKLTWWTIAFLLVGGFILGPFVQKYAFGAWWTGWPFGMDLTDNKTVAALIAWIGAAFAVWKSKKPATWVLVAAIVMFLVYMIPHSLLGSELDYRSAGQGQRSVDAIDGR